MNTPDSNSTPCLKGIFSRRNHLKLKLAIALGVAAAALLFPANASAQCVTAAAGGVWHNTAMTAQTGTFTATFDATPSASPTNSVVALSDGAQTAYAKFSCLARFNPAGDIDARNGGAFAAAATIPYKAGVSYHFRLVVNVAAQTYSIYVTPAGGSELTVGLNYAFRIAATTLNWWGISVETAGTGGVGTVTVCNFSTGGTVSQTSAPTFSPGGGTYTVAQNVTIISATSGASIRYTLDNSTPSETAGTTYSGPVNISSTATLRAIAYKSGFTDSGVTSATYTINPVVSGGDVVGKITVGYQGWFACIGDAAPIHAWWHWSQNWGQAPSPSNNNIKAWPDMREFTAQYQTAYANLGNGTGAKLFSSFDQQTVNTHFLWMQQNGCDTAALQRFNPNTAEGPTRDAMATKVRIAAETYGRKFLIMYDATGWTNVQSEIKTDWTNKMSALTASPAYARQNGKPVVDIWGFGFNDANHPWSAAVCLDIINWFKGQGCYVVGGVPREWRTGTGGSRAGYSGVYHAFNMLSPWMVGGIGTIADADNEYNIYTVPDLADCRANGVDYQPCVLPGDVSARQRIHGDFMWRQFYNMVRAGCSSIYISMYDEFGEGNQIAKTAENSSMNPTNSGLLTLDQDGTACSSDYYLRLTADGGKMMKGQIGLTATRPTPTE